jgi:zinc transporter ZupT
MKIPRNVEQWVKTLLAGVISGSANAVMGSIGAAAIGQPLNWKQIGAVATSGGFIAAVTYLQKSPLPPSEDGNNGVNKP